MSALPNGRRVSRGSQTQRAGMSSDTSDGGEVAHPLQPGDQARLAYVQAVLRWTRA